MCMSWYTSSLTLKSISRMGIIRANENSVSMADRMLHSTFSATYFL